MSTIAPIAPAVNFASLADVILAALGGDPIEVEPTGPSVEDDAWWAAETREVPPADDDDFEGRDWDAEADTSAALDAHERGLIFA